MMTPREEDHSIDELDCALTTYARESRAPFPARRQSLQEMVHRANSDAPMLEQELKEIQRRLGTPDERPGDLERASAVGHQLTNLMCLAVLMQGMMEIN
jgi:hypothetical protein